MTTGKNHRPPPQPYEAIPVEHRLFGLDRRLLWPSFGVFFVVLLWSTIMPAIDAAVAKRVIEAGTKYDLGPAQITPTPGWLLANPPSPVGESTSVTIVKEGVSVYVSAGKFDKSAEELMEHISANRKAFVVEGQAVPVQTAQQVNGLLKRINGPDFTGMLVTFVDDTGHGMEAVIKGPPATSLEVAQPLAEMIQSIEFERDGEEQQP